MLPSLVVDEVRRGVAETLRTQFEPATEHFQDPVRRLIEDPSWIKGPYVQLGMPFLAGGTGRGFFQGFETEHPAFLHQEQAWQRCARDHRSILVATGTSPARPVRTPSWTRWRWGRIRSSPTRTCFGTTRRTSSSPTTRCWTSC